MIEHGFRIFRSSCKMVSTYPTDMPALAAICLTVKRRSSITICSTRINASMDYRRDTELPGVTKTALYRRDTELQGVTKTAIYRRDTELPGVTKTAIYRRDTELQGVAKTAIYTTLNKSNREERICKRIEKKFDLVFNTKFKHNLQKTSVLFSTALPPRLCMIG